MQDKIRAVRDRLQAWEETAWALWLRSPDVEGHLRNQALNYRALVQLLDEVLVELGGENATR